MASKEELVRYLDQHVLTRSEKERYHNYGSADEVVRMYDLHSENAKTVNNKLRELGLPRLVDVQDEFEQKDA